PHLPSFLHDALPISDRRLDRPELLGRDAIYYGHEAVKGSGMPPDEFVAAFDSVERLPDLVIYRERLKVREFSLWRCKGFKGLHRDRKSTRLNSSHVA